MALPKFSVTLDVEGSWDTYKTFTINLRQQLKDPNGPYCFDLPVLPVELRDLNVSRQQWFAMVLKTSKAHITLRIRLQNLYLDAYQKKNNKWVEYVSKAGRLYLSSQILTECDGGYRQLEKDLPGGRKNIPTGWKELVEAVNMLAEMGDGSTPDARKYQIVVIEMISESLRFKRITDFLADGIPHDKIPEWMYYIVWSWGSVSRALLLKARNPKWKFELRSKEESERIQIQTKDEAVQAVGIVKPRMQRLVALQSAADQSSLEMAAEPIFGESMVEVFQLRINRIDGKNEGKLYGTMTVDEAYTQILYTRGRTDAEIVRPGFTPLLTGPTTAPITSSDSFAINVDLKDADTNREISKGMIEWNVYNLGAGKDYDRFVQEEIRGTYGSATISYAVFTEAVSATIGITLINGDGEDPANVYGEVVASNTSISQGQSVLFLKEKEQNVDVRPGQLIPLSRSIVAVPTNSYLNVHAELWDYDAISFNDEIANGTASFQPQMEGTSTKRISGKYGEIEVKVTWDKEY